jgi:argininosuccinate lyase
MAKLWDKGYDQDALMEAFTVGEDHLLDSRLVIPDCVASMAHARMLAAIGILTAAEAEGLREGLARIIGLAEEGRFPILRSDEDAHTAIENHLTSAVGEAGKKIHTGRSRNDQVIAALRLWTRGFLDAFMRETLGLAGRLLELARSEAETPMPGRTHMQVAMPSSVGLWAAAFAEELLDDVVLAQGAYDIADACPLGSAASYGVPLPLNREMTAELLGFSRVQNNVLYANNSRGKTESVVLAAVEQTALTLSRLAQDLIIFSMPEFAYFTLPAELCSGSSIMPQKRNPDGLELVRARSAVVSAERSAVVGILRAMPSGYNRDFQDTKGPYFRGCETGLACVRVMDLTIRSLVVNRERLRSAFTPEIFATDRAMELVASGMPFRDAYKAVGKDLGSLEGADPVEAIRKKTSTGATGNLCLEVARGQAAALMGRVESQAKRSAARLSALAGRPVTLFRDPLSGPTPAQL